MLDDEAKLVAARDAVEIKKGQIADARRRVDEAVSRYERLGAQRDAELAALKREQEKRRQAQREADAAELKRVKAKWAAQRRVELKREKEAERKRVTHGKIALGATVARLLADYDGWLSPSQEEALPALLALYAGFLRKALALYVEAEPLLDDLPSRRDSARWACPSALKRDALTPDMVQELAGGGSVRVTDGSGRQALWTLAPAADWSCWQVVPVGDAEAETRQTVARLRERVLWERERQERD